MNANGEVSESRTQALLKEARLTEAQGGAADPWEWIDRGLASEQGEAMDAVISLALSWGALCVPGMERSAA